MSNAEHARKVAAVVREMAMQPFVLVTEHRYAESWDELAILITLDDNAWGKDVVRLCNSVLGYLNATLPKGNSPFSWQVQFRQRDRIIDVLFPGDTARKGGLRKQR